MLGFRGALSEALALVFSDFWLGFDLAVERARQSLATSVDAQVRVDDVAIHRVVEVSSAWHSSDRVGRWPSRLVAAAAENRLNIRLHSAHLVCGGVHALTALAFIRHFFGVIWAA